MRTPLTDLYAQDKESSDYLMSRVPIGRWGVPEDLNSAVLFLTAPGNPYTSGSTVIVDGGFCGK